MFEDPRRGRQARNFTTNVPKILDFKSPSRRTDILQKLTFGAPDLLRREYNTQVRRFFWRNFIDLSCQLLRSLSFFRTTLVKCLQPTRLPRVLLWCRFSISLVWCRQSVPNSLTLIKFSSTLPLAGYLCDQTGFTISAWRFLSRFCYMESTNSHQNGVIF